MKRVIGTIINHTVLANVLIIILVIAGAVSALSLVRETFPEITPRMFTVVVVYPGADVEEIEEGISRKIEKAIDGL